MRSIFSNAFSQALPGSPSGYLRFEPAALAGFKIERVFLRVGYYAFASDLPFEPADGALDVLIVVHLNSCHSKPSLLLSCCFVFESVM